MGGLSEKDLEPVAKHLAAGEGSKAAYALGALLGTLTGHPLVGVAAGAGAQWLANAATDTATKRFLDAGKKIDDERARVAAYQDLLRSTLAPLFEAQTSKLEERIDELFLTTVRVMRKDLASATGLEELKRAVDLLMGKLELVAGSPPDMRLRMRHLLASHELFAGRDAELDALDAFLAGPGGYALVTGPAGSGKSALLATWLQRALQRDGLVVAYHFISRQHELAGQDDTWRTLVHQLQRGLNASGWSTATVGELEAAYLKALQQPDRPVLVVLDGLDEASRWQPRAELFPSLPANVHVVLAARETGQDWEAQLGIQAASITLGPITEDGIRELFAAGGTPSWSMEAAVLSEVANVSEGDAFYLRQIVADLLPQNGQPPRIGRPEDLKSQPRGLQAYLQRWWNELLEEPKRGAGLKPLLGYLVLAKGPLRAEDLVELGPDDVLDFVTVEPLIAELRRYLVGDAETGFVLCHERFVDFVGTKISEQARKPYRERLIAWCETWATSTSRYPVRHYITHLLDGDPSDAALAVVGGLLRDPSYQAARAGKAFDPAGLRADLARAVAGLARRASADVRLLILCGVEVEVVERQWLEPVAVFGLAQVGRLREAERLLDLSVSDPAWRVVSRLIGAWQAAGARPNEARAALARSRPLLGVHPLLELLRGRVDSALGAGPPPELKLPYYPGQLPAHVPDHVVTGLITRMSGSLEAEGLSGIGQSFAVTGKSGEETPTYIAEGDSPFLVANAMAKPAEGLKALEDYIQLHAANPYADYRNRSLWGVLGAVLCHPDDPSALRLATQCAIGALAKSPIRFSEALAIAVLAKRAHIDQAHAPAFEAALQATLDDLAKPAERDRWAFGVRRLAAFAEALAQLGDAGRARTLLDQANGLTPGFAGFEGPASLTLADACFVVDTGDIARRGAAIDRAHRLVHNIQDPTFCARSTARFNTLSEIAGDVGTLVARLAEAPGAAELAPRHRVADPFHYRRQSDERIPIDELRNAKTLASLAEDVFHQPVAMLLALNPGLGSDTVLPDQTLVAVPDDGFAPVLAAHLGARVLGSPGLAPPDRVALLRALVPVALPDATALDLVLARLVLAIDAPDPAMLDDLAQRVPHARSAARAGHLPSPRVY